MPTEEESIREHIRSLYRDPVKHYVRIEGWLRAARIRLAQLQAAKAGKLAKYFTFPGEFAIDVLLFAEKGIIEENSLGFPGVAFCETRPNILPEINKRLGKCLAVFPFSFERAVFKRSFSRLCPFDIVNLDLTREVFPKDGRPETNTIRAIQHLLDLHSGSSFDLYVTFKSSRREINPVAINEFKGMIDDNFNSNPALEEHFIQSCGMDVAQLLRSDFTLFWCKSFPKWLLEQGIERRIGGQLSGVFSYRRRPWHKPQYDIITFVFTFKRATSSHYMVSHRMITQMQNEIHRSFSISPAKVDDILQSDKVRWQQLAKDVERIIHKAPKIAS
jgi:hypothetical protein